MNSSNIKSPTTDRDIILSGNYGQANFGDDLLAYYMLTHLTRRVEAGRIIVSAPENNYLESWFPGILSLPRKTALAGKSRTQKSLVFGGGGQFFAFPPAAPGNLFGATTCTSSRYWKLVPQLVSGRTRAYAFCVGVGPLAGIGARLVTRILLGCTESISVRDAVSQSLLVKMGIKRSRLAADPAMGIVLPNDIPAAINTHPCVGIVIRQWNHPPDTAPLIHELVKAAQALRHIDWQVEFVSFQAAYDAEVIHRLEKVGEHVMIWKPEEESIAGFLGYLSRFKVLISMRAHGIFTAPQLGVIPIAVALEPKLSIGITNSGYPHNILPTTAQCDHIVRMVEDAVTAGILPSNHANQLPSLASETERLLNWLNR